MERRAAILGTGHYLPTKVVTNDDLAQIMPTTHEWIHQRTGIRERRFIEESGIGASDLAIPAVKMAVEQAGRELKDVDAVLFATLSPDHQFPGAGCLLIHKLGLPGVPALDVRNQCSGFLYSLSVADAWVRAGVYKNVLVVGSEVHSTGVEFNERGRDVAVLFGDGAGAALIGEATRPEQGIRALELHADGSGAYDLWLEAPASKFNPRLTHEMLDAGKHYPHMNGKKVFKHAVTRMPQAIMEGMIANGLKLDDVDMVIPHQANLRINQFVAKMIGLPEHKMHNNIQKTGNTTAATIPICMHDAIGLGKIKPGDLVCLVAFGAGLTWGSAFLRY